MLREQVITPRSGRGGAQTKGRGGEIMQRPARRKGGGRGGAQSSTGSWRRALAWMPLTGKFLVAVCAGVVVFSAYRAAASSTFFEVRNIDVGGATRASSEQLKSVVRRAAGSTNVWNADLEAISMELERQPWVRSAIVSRVLPSGLRVRITERSPRVVVRNSAGRFVWVDDDGVMVGALGSTDPMPAFFMRGLDESSGDAARAENRKRVELFQTLAREWAQAGLAARVSEVNLDDLRDVRAQLAGDDSQIEVRLGKEDLSKRLRQALQVLDEQRQTPRGALITYIDMTQGKRAVIGTKTQAQRQSRDETGATLAQRA